MNTKEGGTKRCGTPPLLEYSLLAAMRVSRQQLVSSDIFDVSWKLYLLHYICKRVPKNNTIFYFNLYDKTLALFIYNLL